MNKTRKQDTDALYLNILKSYHNWSDEKQYLNT